jgi:hypothetical protein
LVTHVEYGSDASDEKADIKMAMEHDVGRGSR